MGALFSQTGCCKKHNQHSEPLNLSDQCIEKHDQHSEMATLSDQCGDKHYQHSEAFNLGDQSGEKHDEPSEQPNLIGHGTVTYRDHKHTASQECIGDDNSDVTIKVGDKEYKLHKSVLIKSSDYFAAMFSHDMVEKVKEWIELQEVDAKYVDAVLSYIYDGSFSLDEEIMEGVIRTAQYLQVNWILLKSCEFLSTHITISSFQQVLHLIEAYSLDVLNPEDLRNNVLLCLGNNLVLLSQQPGFYENLSFGLLLHFLQDNIPCRAAERDVLRITMDWVHEVQAIREKYMLELLQQIRFPLLTEKELDGLPAKILSYHDIQREVNDAREIVGSEKIRCLKGSHKSLPRGSHRAVMITDGKYRRIDYYDVSNGHSHTEFPVVPYTDFREAKCVVESRNRNFLFFLCCDTSGHYRLLRYDPIHRTFTKLDGIGQFAPYGISMVCSSSSVFILYCSFPQQQLKLHAYDLDLEKWSLLPNLPKHHLFNSSICYNDDTLYISGRTTFLALRLGTEIWEVLPSMPHPRYGHFTCVIGDKLYVVGGVDPEGCARVSECEVYDLITGQWTDIVSLPRDMEYSQQVVAVVDNNIAVLLRSPGTELRHLYMIDVEKNTISKVNDFDKRKPYSPVIMCSVSIPPMP